MRGTQSVHNKCSALPLSFVLPRAGPSKKGFFSHAPKEEKPGPHFFIHNFKFQKPLKTKTFFLSLPLHHLVTKPDLN